MHRWNGLLLNFRRPRRFTAVFVDHVPTPLRPVPRKHALRAVSGVSNISSLFLPTLQILQVGALRLRRLDAQWSGLWLRPAHWESFAGTSKLRFLVTPL